jgi:hypothetical protein
MENSSENNSEIKISDVTRIVIVLLLSIILLMNAQIV